MCVCVRGGGGEPEWTHLLQKEINFLRIGKSNSPSLLSSVEDCSAFK